MAVACNKTLNCCPAEVFIAVAVAPVELATLLPVDDVLLVTVGLVTDLAAVINNTSSTTLLLCVVVLIIDLLLVTALIMGVIVVMVTCAGDLVVSCEVL